MSWPFDVPGIPDELFVREERVPMTKEEVRAVVVSKMRLRRGQRVIDVGCGSGSTTVEFANAVGNEGMVYALDKDPKAVELTKVNLSRFNLVHRTAVSLGEAPQALLSIPGQVDRAFVGGSDKLRETLTTLRSLLVNGGKVVVDAILLQTVVEAISTLEELGFTNLEVTELIVAKSLKTGRGHAMMARNPIFVVGAEKP
ncbi:cobalt-precorrin-6Y C(15)-methyltransferase [Sulfodiicoccus acidiphilus]|uniref:Probable cobalt-precorrin-6B C(15)-methyltransferase (decarboxylating) n=1 Tax=Sulfodiicoccus acidiphilus TaxID=1670455 RepID=A0A348B2N1_9CREN|nr:precorrin-6Y C5,15-methyltransferase (decarboxylating) subunit CbiT [Sulfodiicoccus acidiphilus]BBD72433.1 cobalt-precorrin-6Y C(15)-methyltransferase [Sulfodiicoccus acidiphilus]GGT97164.1 cobalt-precorrin-6Y C(15)-methyltransferase [Sulfodiicoccus acidiphilus]